MTGTSMVVAVADLPVLYPFIEEAGEAGRGEVRLNSTS